MIAPRTWLCIALAASIGFTAGCGGTNTDTTDTAEVIKKDPATTKDTPAPAPEAPSKDAPKR